MICQTNGLFVDKKMWSRKATTILINEYKKNECLWMTTSPYYRHKQKRNEALSSIAAIVRKCRPHTTAENVRYKINGIRAQLYKVLTANANGKECVPSLWCYNMLSFLKPIIRKRQKNNDLPLPEYTLPKQNIENDVNFHEQKSSKQSSKNESDILIKEETDDDIEIIEEDILQTTEDHSYNVQEIEQNNVKTNENTNKQSFTITDDEEEIQQQSSEENQSVIIENKEIFVYPILSSEITLLPKKNTTKTRHEEMFEENIEERNKKAKDEKKLNGNEEANNRIEIFGKFVMNQMKIITDSVLLLKLEHTIQNAIIEAQIKQMEINEEMKKKKEY